MKKVLLTIIFTVALLVGVTAAFSTGVLGMQVLIHILDPAMG